MTAVYESVIFTNKEARFVVNTIYSYSQNRAIGNPDFPGALVPFSAGDLEISTSILAKTNLFIQNSSKPIIFTQAEAKLMQTLFFNYMQVHGKAQGDLEWTYYMKFDPSTQQLVVDTLRKIGARMPNFAPTNEYPKIGIGS